MSEPSALGWLSFALNLLPALVWAILCERTWWILRTRRPPSRLYSLLPVVTGGMTGYYVLSALVALFPLATGEPVPRALALLGAFRDISLLGVIVSGRHLLFYFPDAEDPPSSTWLAVTYGSTLAVAIGLLLLASGPATHLGYQLLYEGCAIANLALGIAYTARTARRGEWGHAGLTAIRTSDVVFFTTGLVLAGLLLHVVPFAESAPWKQPLLLVVLNCLVGLLISIPIAMRMLGEVLRTLVVASCLIGATFLVYFGLEWVFALGPSSLESVGKVVTLLAILLLLGPGQRWLTHVLGRVVFRRSHYREAQLHAVLHTLSPELGAVECCRRALAEFVQVMQARGAAVLLTPEGTAVVEGAIEMEALKKVWPTPAAAEQLYRDGFGLLEMRELPAELREPLLEANVVGAFPIVSPRRRWGHLFLSSGLLGTVITDEDGQVIHAFTDQLGLALDSTELLARVVTVERSLAHAEKLSAIGELAARIAHEIRNPVTAARSLAQILCRDPTSPLNAEHAGLILTELERVERQIAALLRFARREELHRETVDLGALVRETVDQFHMRLETAGIGFDLEAPEGIVAQVDREKIRQALINLIENSIDALADANGDRRISLTLARDDGHALFAVADSGPGVPPESLPHIFEPFFSLKTHGTGLGLAIVKRTIEAHGGRVSANGCPGGGLALELDLPIERHA